MIYFTIISCTLIVCITVTLALNKIHGCKHKFKLESTGKTERRRHELASTNSKYIYEVTCLVSRCEHCGRISKEYVE